MYKCISYDKLSKKERKAKAQSSQAANMGRGKPRHPKTDQQQGI